MSIIEVKNMIKQVEEVTGNKFEKLFDEKQQEEIMDLIESCLKIEQR
jgi:predicted Ser/Thr protein kinase